MDSRINLNLALQKQLENAKLMLEKEEEELAIAKIETQLLENGFFRSYTNNYNDILDEFA